MYLYIIFGFLKMFCLWLVMMRNYMLDLWNKTTALYNIKNWILVLHLKTTSLYNGCALVTQKTHKALEHKT